MANEDFTTYTEIDPNAHLTVVASKVTFADLSNDEDAYVYKDFGANYFSDSLGILLTLNLTAMDSTSWNQFYVCSLANLVDDYRGIDTANGDALAVQVYRSPSLFALSLSELDGGIEYGSGYHNIASLPVTLYLKLVRDESVGTYGTAYLYVYSDEARTNLLITLSVTLHSSKKDFRYLYAVQTWNWSAVRPSSGYVENLELLALASPIVTTQAVTSISRTTATGNGNVTGLGVPHPTQHGHCWNTTGSPTTADSKTQNGVKNATGAFTSAITGLVTGTKYYVRAYATNAQGTSYGNEVNFTTFIPKIFYF